MRRGLLQSSAFGFCAIGLSLLSQSAQANPVLPNLVNLNFVNNAGPGTPKDYFNKIGGGGVNPVGWQTSATRPDGGQSLVFIAKPGLVTDPNSACGSNYLQTYVCPSTLAIGPYNEVEADGNPAFESGFNYTVTGLTAGVTYDLSFYQAAGQQTTFTGATTERWIVSLGTAGLTIHTIDSTHDGFGNADGSASIQSTTLMNTPSQGGFDWNAVTVHLTADASTDILSFLAWGNEGSTVNLPPMLFLTGVNSPTITGTPEPGSILLFGTVLLGVGGVIRRRRRVPTV